jgi:FSR family fosmidomycin resistance protein-like MFS transporter
MAMGIRGSLLLLIPAFVFAIILHKHMKGLGSVITAHKNRAKSAGHANQRYKWIPFGFLTSTIICRSIIFFGFNTFLPLYWIHDMSASAGADPKAAGGMALTVLLMSSAAGTFLGGKLGDRFGGWKVSLIALSLLPLTIALFLAATRADLAMLSLVPLGMCLSATFSIMVVMGQSYLPTRIGLAAGITLGLAGSIGGLVTPLLGRIGDTYGLHAALSVLLAVAATSLVLATCTMVAERRENKRAVI